MDANAQNKLLPEVEDFLSNGPLRAMIGGQQVESSNGNTFETHDPGSGEKLAEIFNMQTEDVNHAVDTATETFKGSGWAKLPQNERSVHMHRLADAVEKHKAVFDQLESLDCGKVLVQAEMDIQNFIDTMRYYGDLALHVQRRTVLPAKGHEAFTVRLPWGPCGFIIPWNFPFLLAGWGIGPAMAAGNTCVIKPAEDSPLSTLYLAHVAKDAGIPDGVINVIPGLGEVTGAALAGNPNLKRMSFTGSPEIGREIASKCGANLVPIKCELGGKGAAVVCDDVDIPDTAQKLVEAITFHTGQVCCDATRWLIQKDIYDSFVSECVDRMQKIHIGYQLDESTQMGPVVSRKQEERVLGYLERGVKEGAELVLEGGKAEVPSRNGHYVKPALLAGSLDNVAACEEIFGPVAYLAPYDTDEQAIEMTNNTDYGLGNSVWSSNLERAHGVAEQMVAGNSWINGHNLIVHGVPYAGIGKSGMGGGVLSIETLLDYWRPLTVLRPL